MTQGHTVSSQVEVAIDPGTAFLVFTDEMDLWWERGFINFFSDAGRVVQVCCEPGVGGRILEVLDDPDAGEVFVRGRFTAWEPGVRLRWETPFDDVLTEVRFEPVPGGTRVVVEHTVPAGGSDAGGTSWARVVPAWLGSWCARREGSPRVPDELSRLGLVIAYRRPATALRWLNRVFGLGDAARLPEGDDPLPEGEHGQPWLELRIGDAAVVVRRLDGERPPVRTFEPWVHVDDLDGHFARARAEGATIVTGIERFPQSHYVADDLEGNRWTFLQARPTMR